MVNTQLDGRAYFICLYKLILCFHKAYDDDDGRWGAPPVWVAVDISDYCSQYKASAPVKVSIAGDWFLRL